MIDRRRAPNLKSQFTSLLNRAITSGEMPDADEIGPSTTAAIQRIAMEHPEASPLDVSRAHDAFNSEHGDDDANSRAADTEVKPGSARRDRVAPTR